MTGTTAGTLTRGRAQPSAGGGRGAGWVGAIEQRARLAAEQLQERQRKALQSAGVPWRHTRISERDALARIQEWSVPTVAPEVQKQAAGLSDRELVSAALDAVKRIERATRRGEWVPGVGPVEQTAGIDGGES